MTRLVPGSIASVGTELAFVCTFRTASTVLLLTYSWSLRTRSGDIPGASFLRVVGWLVDQCLASWLVSPGGDLGRGHENLVAMLVAEQRKFCYTNKLARVGSEVEDSS